MKKITDIPIITLWRPWAFWIAYGWKTIETRLHTKFAKLEGKIIGIHAGKKWDNTALKQADKYLNDFQKEYTEKYSKKRLSGEIVAFAKVKEHRLLNEADSEKALIDCSTAERYGLFLEFTHNLFTEIYAKGHQGIWYYKEK